jgi:hypothetical protein
MAECAEKDYPSEAIMHPTMDWVYITKSLMDPIVQG